MLENDELLALTTRIVVSYLGGNRVAADAGAEGPSVRKSTLRNRISPG
jgi:hypothetical protein